MMDKADVSRLKFSPDGSSVGERMSSFDNLEVSFGYAIVDLSVFPA